MTEEYLEEQISMWEMEVDGLEIELKDAEEHLRRLYELQDNLRG